MAAGSLSNADSQHDVLAPRELVLNKLITTSAIEVANATQTITISALGPAGIGTATISKWLQFTGSDGVVYYIPVWT